MQQGCLTTEDLLALTHFESVAALRRALERDRVAYFVGKGGKPWTTVDLVNAAKGLRPAEPERPLGAEIL